MGHGEEYAERINGLQARLNQVRTVDYGNKTSFNANTLITKPYVYYTVAPFIVLIGLLMTRPTFIFNKDENDEINTKKISIKLLFKWVAIITPFVWISTFIFMKYQSKKCGTCSL